MAKVLFLGDRRYLERLLAEGKAGGDLAFVFGGGGGRAGALVAGSEFDGVVWHSRRADARILSRLQSSRERGAPPCLILLEEASPQATLALLEAGAAEVVSADLSAREVISHVRALVRRPPTAPWPGVGPQVLRAGRLALDLARYQALVADRPLELAPREFALLRYLLERLGQACRREELTEQVWGGAVSARSRTLDVHVGRLRRKLEGAGITLVTVPGIGYRLDSD